MRRNAVNFCILTLLLSVALIGCSEKEEDEYALARVEFANAGGALTGGGAPTTYGIVLMWIDIVNPNAASGSQGAQIWGNPKCSAVEMKSDGKVVGERKGDAECAAAGPTYFDLARDSEVVNAELNSQTVYVLPGTYSIVRLGLLGEQQGGSNAYNNTKWAAADVPEREFASIVTEWSGTIDPPLELGEGESAVVKLNYSLAGTVTTGLSGATVKVPGQGTNQGDAHDDCNDERTVCIDAPTLTVTVTK